MLIKFIMTLISKPVLAIAAGVCGTLFVGYCIYFDHKRHKDPEFKRKLRERRQAKRTDATPNNKRGVGFPDMKDYQAVQRFFVQEVQLSEEFMAANDIESAVDHMANAVAVCDQPNELLQVLQQTFPPNVFHLLIQRLPLIAPSLIQQAPRMTEEDVE